MNEEMKNVVEINPEVINDTKPEGIASKAKGFMKRNGKKIGAAAAIIAAALVGYGVAKYQPVGDSDESTDDENEDEDNFETSDDETEVVTF